MAHSIERVLEPDRCEAVVSAIADFVDRHYDEANIRARRAHVYEYGLDMEAFAFPVHFPARPRPTCCRASTSTRSPSSSGP